MYFQESHIRTGKLDLSVSHSTTEPKIISLDPGLRLDGLPA